MSSALFIRGKYLKIKEFLDYIVLCRFRFEFLVWDAELDVEAFKRHFIGSLNQIHFTNCLNFYKHSKCPLIIIAEGKRTLLSLFNIFINKLTKCWGKYYYYHFTDGETEVYHDSTRADLSQSWSFKKWPQGPLKGREISLWAALVVLPCAARGGPLPGCLLFCTSLVCLALSDWVMLLLALSNFVPEPEPSPCTLPCSFDLVLPGLINLASSCPDRGSWPLFCQGPLCPSGKAH